MMRNLLKSNQMLVLMIRFTICMVYGWRLKLGLVLSLKILILNVMKAIGIRQKIEEQPKICQCHFKKLEKRPPTTPDSRGQRASPIGVYYLIEKKSNTSKLVNIS